MAPASTEEAFEEKPSRGKRNKISKEFSLAGADGEPVAPQANPVSEERAALPNISGGQPESLNELLRLSMTSAPTLPAATPARRPNQKESILPESAIPADELACMSECIDALQAIAEQLGPEWSVEPFGSVANGFGTQGSDLDLTFVRFAGHEARHGPEAVLTLQGKLQPRIQQSEHFEVIQEIYGAKVPILKLRFKKRLEVDVSCFNKPALRNTQLLLAYSRMSRTLCDFLVAVKIWAKAAQVCGATDRNLSSYAFTLMALYYLQVCGEARFHLPVLPCAAFEDGRYGAEDHETRQAVGAWKPPVVGVRALLRGFFRFFGEAATEDGETFRQGPFWWGREVVSVRLGRREIANPTSISNDDVFYQLPHRWASRIHIEDPFELDRNLHCVLTIERENRLREALREALDNLNRGEQPIGLEILGREPSPASEHERAYFLQARPEIAAAPPAQPAPFLAPYSANAPHSGHLDRDAIAHNQTPTINTTAANARPPVPLQPGPITPGPITRSTPAPAANGAPKWPAPQESQVPSPTALTSFAAPPAAPPQPAPAGRVLRPAEAAPVQKSPLSPMRVVPSISLEPPKKDLPEPAAPLPAVPPMPTVTAASPPAPTASRNVVPNRQMAPRVMAPGPVITREVDNESLSAEDTDPVPPAMWLGGAEETKPKFGNKIDTSEVNKHHEDSIDKIKAMAKLEALSQDFNPPNKPQVGGQFGQSDYWHSKGLDAEKEQAQALFGRRPSGPPGEAGSGNSDAHEKDSGVEVRRFFEGRKWFQNLQSSRVQEAVGEVLKHAQEGSALPAADARVQQAMPAWPAGSHSVAELESRLARPGGGPSGQNGIGVAHSNRWNNRKATKAIMQKINSSVPQDSRLVD